MLETDHDLLYRMFQAYYDARKNKRNTHSQLRFEIDHEARLIELYHAVRERRYQVRPSIAFIVKEPLKREVFAAEFTDRVIHHLLFNLINPVFEALFIPESFSCRAGKNRPAPDAGFDQFVSGNFTALQSVWYQKKGVA